MNENALRYFARSKPNPNPGSEHGVLEFIETSILCFDAQTKL